ncbi:MAG: nucleotidyltransferase domain-containing protein [Candidatus Blackburnbacteria bacterium]|nr:nucleotidyltransferase domain-containing protein [Candidatus Blackburnbacteria bacterium]
MKHPSYTNTAGYLRRIAEDTSWLEEHYSSIESNVDNRLLFLSLSGSHVYGFPDEASDFDLRGCHIDDMRAVLSLHPGNQTHEKMYELDGRKVDYVTHEVKKFLLLMITPNGNILEQVYSPFTLYEHPLFEDVKTIAAKCITKKLYNHYYGFSQHMIHHCRDDAKKRNRKDIEYCYRTLLAGRYVLENGSFEHNLYTLCDYYDVAINKVYPFKDFDSMLVDLKKAQEESKLPIDSNVYEEANNLLINIRNILRQEEGQE